VQPVPVIPEIDIWRAANLMLKRYGDKALEESAARGDDLAAQDDYSGGPCGAGSPTPFASSQTRRPPGRSTDHSIPPGRRRARGLSRDL
jgi:hypothetical protein